MKVYLDNNATTKLDPRVLAAMVEELASDPSNPSSIHLFGKEAKARYLQAKETIARVLHIRPEEIIFTSSATEALNMLIKGSKAQHIITSTIEHASVQEPLKGLNVTYLPVNSVGLVEGIENAIQENTELITLSAVNSETGVKNDLAAISQIAEAYSIPLIIDGVGLLGKELFTIPTGVTAMVFSAHKLHGPTGVGMAFVRSNYSFTPLLTGGSQELNKRAGTENLPGIIGFAKAIELLESELPEATARMEKLRDLFESQLLTAFPFISINGEGKRICNTSNLSFGKHEAELLLMLLDLEGIAASHGSACSSNSLQPSKTLTQMGYSKERVLSSIRFSLSRFTTEQEIEYAVEKLTQTLGSLCFQ